MVRPFQTFSAGSVSEFRARRGRRERQIEVRNACALEVGREAEEAQDNEVAEMAFMSAASAHVAGAGARTRDPLGCEPLGSVGRSRSASPQPGLSPVEHEAVCRSARGRPGGGYI